MRGADTERASDPLARVEVLWRPGCPYCSRLRHGLARAGIGTVQQGKVTPRSTFGRQ
jgi:hypothetical protein